MQSHSTAEETPIRPPTNPLAPTPNSDVGTHPGEVEGAGAQSRLELRDFRLAVEAHFAALRAARSGNALDSRLIREAEATREALDREVSRIEAAIHDAEPSSTTAELNVIAEGLRSLRLAQLKILDLMRSFGDGTPASQ